MTTKSWSYSQLSAYEQCPHKWMYQRIVKLPEPPSYHLTNGNYVHSLAENFLKGKITEIPKELSKFTKEFNNLKAANAVAEQPIVLRSDWSYLGGEEAWGSKDAWLRMKIDASIGNDYLIDFKTGKKYDEHVKQAKLYANTMLMLDMHQHDITVEFWYLNSGEVVDYTFTRDNLDSDIADWEAKVYTMHNDNEYKPRVHEWCKYCYVKHLCTAYE